MKKTIKYLNPLLAMYLNFGIVYPLLSLAILKLPFNDNYEAMITMFLSYIVTTFIISKIEFFDFNLRNLIGKYTSKNIALGLSTGVLMFITQQITASFIITDSVTADNVNYITQQGMIFTILTTMIGAPIFEELFFRGLFKELTKDLPDWYFYLSSGVIFGFLHLQNLNNLLFAIYNVVFISILGVIMAVIYKKSNWIGTSIIAHALFNSISIILYFIFLK